MAKNVNSTIVTKEDFDKFSQLTYFVMGGIILVLFVSVIALIFALAAILGDVWMWKADSAREVIRDTQIRDVLSDIEDEIDMVAQQVSKIPLKR